MEYTLFHESMPAWIWTTEHLQQTSCLYCSGPKTYFGSDHHSILYVTVGWGEDEAWPHTRCPWRDWDLPPQRQFSSQKRARERRASKFLWYFVLRAIYRWSKPAWEETEFILHLHSEVFLHNVYVVQKHKEMCIYIYAKLHHTRELWEFNFAFFRQNLVERTFGKKGTTHARKRCTHKKSYKILNNSTQ